MCVCVPDVFFVQLLRYEKIIIIVIIINNNNNNNDSRIFTFLVTDPYFLSHFSFVVQRGFVNLEGLVLFHRRSMYCLRTAAPQLKVTARHPKLPIVKRCFLIASTALPRAGPNTCFFPLKMETLGNEENQSFWGVEKA